jgi:hypothetical protein
LDYFTDTVTFARRIILGGADPSHSPDLRKLGGEFHCYLEGGKRGWVFGISMEPALESYIKTGKVAKTPQKPVNVLYMSKEGEKKDTGMCSICKKVQLDAAVKSYVRFYTGGLPSKVTGQLMDKDYRSKISVAFGNGTFTSVQCMQGMNAIEARCQTPPPADYSDSEPESDDE